MKTVYHGSNNGNIEVLKPHISTHRKSCVYATENRCIALLFMGKSHGDLDTMIGYIDDELTLVERREGVFDNIYNHSGYLYELEGETFNHYDFLWSGEVISYEEVKVKKKIEIKNIKDEILKEEKKGNIKVYRYPSRPSNIPLDNSDLISKYQKFQEQGIPHAIDDLLKVYPEFKDKLKKD